MEHLLGLTGLLMIGIITLYLALRLPSLQLVLLVAFLVRAGAALFHFYVAPLPDGTADAITFERYAWEWSQGGLAAAFSHYPGIDTYFYSWLMSLVYSITDRSPLLLQSFSVLMGVLGVLGAWRLAREIWGQKTGRRAAWCMALFPAVVMYGALTMREAWFVFFLLTGLIGAVRWAKKGGFGPVVWSVCGFTIASFFHGGAFVAVISFLGIIGWQAGRRWLAGLARGRVRLVACVCVLAVSGALVFYVVSGISIPKLGTAGEMVSTERWMDYFQSRVYGGARYPEWTQPRSAADFVWAVPLRTVYLLFSPFPWDLREPSHLIGFIDGLFYLVLVVFLWRGRRVIRQSPEARMVFLILVPLVFAYGVGTGNFGTALRHRAKLAVGLIILASPRLPGFLIGGRRYGYLKQSGACPSRSVAH